MYVIIKIMKYYKETELEKLRKDIEVLKDSPLYFYRIKNNYQPVVGEGNSDAKLVFVGEAPGRNEAESGRPFVGAAGKILDSLLRNSGINRNDVYITSVIKDRPPANRDPKPKELEIYLPYLWQQLEIIKPKIIGTLGRISTRAILEKYGIADSKKSISQIHGKEYQVSDRGRVMVIIPLYHPAAVIYNQRLRQQMETDMKKVGELLNNS